VVLFLTPDAATTPAETPTQQRPWCDTYGLAELFMNLAWD